MGHWGKEAAKGRAKAKGRDRGGSREGEGVKNGEVSVGNEEDRQTAEQPSRLRALLLFVGNVKSEI